MVDSRSYHVVFVGGLGYVGSHTVVSVLEHASNNLKDAISSISGNSDDYYENIKLTILDNCINTDKSKYDSFKRLHPSFDICLVVLDICDSTSLSKFFKDNVVDAVLHFAALKALSESFEKVIEYYDTNVVGSINLLKAMEMGNCFRLVFSSTAALYCTEETFQKTEPFREEETVTAVSPYGETKAVIERMLQHLGNSGKPWKICILRYFNVVGYHPSGLFNNTSLSEHKNLFDAIQDVAIGTQDYLAIFGNDYDTRDGTCIRDYVDVMDIAEGHWKALVLTGKEEKAFCTTVNLGSGCGTSVKEMSQMYSDACGHVIASRDRPRRNGDAPVVVADIARARNILMWKPIIPLSKSCSASWNALAH